LFIESKAEYQRRFQQRCTPALRARTAVELFRRETPDFIAAPNAWLPNITLLFSGLQNLGSATEAGLSTSFARCRCEFRQRLIDSWSSIQRTVIDQALLIGGDFGRVCKLRPEADSLNIDTVQCFTIALFYWSIRFHTLY